MSAAEKARKLIDLHNLAVYWDTQLLGDLEGASLVVCILRNQPARSLIQCAITGCINKCQVIGCGFNGPNDL